MKKKIIKHDNRAWNYRTAQNLINKIIYYFKIIKKRMFLVAKTFKCQEYVKTGIKKEKKRNIKKETRKKTQFNENFQ